jgi:hypothetical protein
MKDKQKKRKLTVKKDTIRALTPGDLEKVRGGEDGSVGSICTLDTYLSGCTDYNCGYSYRNCPSWTCEA